MASDFDPDLTELQQLQQSADDLQTRLIAADQAVVESSGRDETESIRVTLGHTGRVTAVEVAADWRQRLTAAGLGTAVTAAVQEAGRRRLETWADAAGRPPGRHTSASLPDTAPITTKTVSVGDPTDPASANFIRGLLHVIQDASSRYHDLAAELESRAHQEMEGHDEDRRVRVTLVGEILTAVTFDERWLAGAHPADVGAAITGAVHTAYAALNQQADTSLRNSWPFDELERLTSDPAQLLANLGLTGHPDPSGR